MDYANAKQSQMRGKTLHFLGNAYSFSLPLQPDHSTHLCVEEAGLRSKVGPLPPDMGCSYAGVGCIGDGNYGRGRDKEPKPHDKMHRMELSLPEDVFLKIAPHLQASHVCALGKPFLEGIMLLRLTLGEVRSQEMAFLVDFDQGILSSG
ncbi:hypothetical protein MLD38_023554 [Melastoma candidum]|uniref:Uncharacterized protein n=1 Tax=Melastoma candidum TaxID=119954 RepID=A0ACB9NPT5_9MYRT|nr:hypothetical protein MLD38_023554 [Melastoma candidum]